MLKTYSCFNILSIFYDNIFVFAIFFVQIYNYQLNCLCKLHNKLQNIKSNEPQNRLSLVKRAVSGSWLRDWKTFCLYTIFGCKFGWKFPCKSGYLTKVNPSGFSFEKPPPFTCYALWVQGRQCYGFLGLLFTAEIWWKQVVWQPLFWCFWKSF